MNILMLSNTYLPCNNGVSNSIYRFKTRFQSKGHNVLIITPTFEGVTHNEPDIIRIPAIQKFNGSDYSVSLPVPGVISNALADFKPDIIHSHHPFLLGDTALRLAAIKDLPLIYTQHTLHDQYTHYTPVDSPLMQNFVRELTVGYTNLCDHVIAPSQSIKDSLQQRGTTVPISVIPTGVDLTYYQNAQPESIRNQHNIPSDAFVIGYVGRLAPEKNLDFLSRAVCKYMQQNQSAWFLVVGKGPSEETIQKNAEALNVADRLAFTGERSGKQIVDCYHAMDMFAFASKTETQGMVLAEAMASSTPVVALDAFGSRDLVINGENGFLITKETTDAFIQCFDEIQSMPDQDRQKLMSNAKQFVDSHYSVDKCAQQILELYQSVNRFIKQKTPLENTVWYKYQQRIKKEWEIWSNRFSSVITSIQDQSKE